MYVKVVCSCGIRSLSGCGCGQMSDLRVSVFGRGLLQGGSEVQTHQMTNIYSPRTCVLKLPPIEVCLLVRFVEIGPIFEDFNGIGQKYGDMSGYLADVLTLTYLRSFGMNCPFCLVLLLWASVR